jgi:dTDP-L-rhamnose 4-epimerase
MRILVSGGAGFIGSHLCRALTARGHVVTALDNLSPQVHGPDAAVPPPLREGVRFVRGDVRDRGDWARALEGQEAVVHLAAETGTGQSMYAIERYVDVNVRGTALLLDVLANGRHAVRKLVVASSRAIYGEGKYLCAGCGVVYPGARRAEDMERGDFAVKCPACGTDVRMVPTDEESRIHPSSIYGITKHAQEQLVLTAARSLGIPAWALRYQNVYGPGQSLSNPYTGILSIFSTRIRNGNEIVIFEDGTESRDFVFVDDVVRATVAATEDAGPGGEALNVGSGVATDVLAVVRGLLSAYGAEVPVRIGGGFRVGDIRHNVADLSRVRARLGFEPTVPFAEGLRRFAGWVGTQSTATDRYEESMRELRDKGLFA